MSHRLLPILAVATLLSAADKKLPIDETSNDLLAISVSAPLDKDQIKQELGSDLGDDIVVIRLTARPVSDKPVQLSLDDFLLVSGKDGQRSEPYAPGQLAGSDSLSVTPNGVRRGGLGDHPHRPTLGIGGIGIGGGGAGATPPPDVKVQETGGEKRKPPLGGLNRKNLSQKENPGPPPGAFFFQLVGK